MINQLGNKIILYLTCTWMCLNCQLKLLFIHNTDKEHKWNERNFYNAKVTKNFCKSTDNKIGNSMLAEYLNTHMTMLLKFCTFLIASLMICLWQLRKFKM